MAIPKSPIGCPMDSLLRLLMGPWTTYILYVLRAHGPTRFGELKRRVPAISPKGLTQRLRMLAQGDIITRPYEPTIPPQVTYTLAARGGELADVIDRLDALAKKWMTEDAAVQQRETPSATSAMSSTAAE